MHKERECVDFKEVKIECDEQKKLIDIGLS